MPAVGLSDGWERHMTFRYLSDIFVECSAVHPCLGDRGSPEPAASSSPRPGPSGRVTMPVAAIFFRPSPLRLPVYVKAK